MQKELKRLIPLILLGLYALFQTACATPSKAVARTEIVTPPAAFLAPCEKPETGELRTNGDLARYASALVYALDACAAKVEALRVFFLESVDKPE